MNPSKKPFLQFIRVLVGLLFIFSGLIKANDPYGLAYKMDEYFAVWNWQVASDYSLYLSVALNVLEIVAGLALLLGWAAEFFTRLLLLLIIFFTFLTGYAVLSGKIKSCGCFGDCLPIKPWQSFTKDLMLLLLIVLLHRYRQSIQPLLPTRASLFLVLFSIGFVFWGQLHIIKHLPYVDCLPYKKGNNLFQKMQPPPGSITDSVAIFYTYKHGGKTVSFDATHFPDDFDENSYEYVSREEKLVRKGNAEPAIKDLAMYTSSGQDTTKAILNLQGKYLLFFAKDFGGTAMPWQELFVKIFSMAHEKNIPMFLVTNQPTKAQAFFNESNHFSIPVLSCDGTVMKTFLRSQTGIVAMNGPVVAGKWSEADMNDAVRWMNERP